MATYEVVTSDPQQIVDLILDQAVEAYRENEANPGNCNFAYLQGFVAALAAILDSEELPAYVVIGQAADQRS